MALVALLSARTLGQGLFDWPITLFLRWNKSCRHRSGYRQAETVCCRDTSQADCGYSHQIRAGSGIGIKNFRTLQSDTVSETPTIGPYDVVGICRLSAKNCGRSTKCVLMGICRISPQR